LIGFSIETTLLFYIKRSAIAVQARRLLGLITAIFAVSLLLATAGNARIGYPLLSVHALWQLVATFGFVAL